jgi:heme-degrading monooxygenase HmoA
MYIRIIRGEVKAGQVDEFAKRWQGFVPDRMRATAGFRRAYLLADRETNAVGSVSVWDSRPDRAAVDRTMAEFRPTVDDLTGGSPPRVEEYEVLGEV